MLTVMLSENVKSRMGFLTIAETKVNLVRLFVELQQ